MKFLKQHIGSIVIIPLIALCFFFPFHDGGILPDPWETLFDWTGEIGAYSYLATIVFCINCGWIFILASLLDRSPIWHGPAFVFPVVLLIPLFFYSSFTWIPALIAGFLMAICAVTLYLVGIALKKGLTMASTQLPTRYAFRS